MVGFEEQLVRVRSAVEEELILPHYDPVVLELNRLQNLLKDKDRELGAAHGEIKGLRTNDALKDKAIEELRIQINKLNEKLCTSEGIIEDKNLEIKKIVNERREAVSAQFAAEAALRRVHANHKDDASPSIELFIAPLEAEIKMYKNEIAALVEDRKAMERLNKSKEVALLEAESILKSALERALIVEEVQNQNYELKRQIEIFQEENSLLEKTNRQKVVEVEKLSQTIKELEETVLASGAAANAVRDYKRQIIEVNEEKRMLERELARANVSVNRVATIVANEWKDDNDKVMPIKQWLEDRRLMQAEIQKLKDKLVISERTAKAEAQLKDKFKLRLTTLEEGLKHKSSMSPKHDKHGSILGFLTSNAGVRKRSETQPRASTHGKGFPSQQPNIGTEKRESDSSERKHNSTENMMRKSLWAARSMVVGSSGKENEEGKANADTNADKNRKDNINTAFTATNEEVNEKGNADPGAEDVVSGFLYDKLQKEVTYLRRACEVKDDGLNAKDQQIQILMRKVDSLTKSIEVEAKKQKRQAGAKDKETGSGKVDGGKQTAASACTNPYRRSWIQ
ncbi:Microtubule-associated protein 70-5 [Linum perenne]